MAELDRPKRPDSERDLLYAMDDMDYDACRAAEDMIQYADALEDHCSSLDHEIDKLVNELGFARQQVAQRTQDADENKQLKARVAEQEKTIAALASAMGETERQEWEQRVQGLTNEWDNKVKERDHHIAGLSQELAFLQVKLGAIQLIMR